MAHEKFQKQKSFNLEQKQIFSASTAKKHHTGDYGKSRCDSSRALEKYLVYSVIGPSVIKPDRSKTAKVPKVKLYKPYKPQPWMYF
jgi:hypothetical protein